jgi:hypothetical protein
MGQKIDELFMAKLCYATRWTPGSNYKHTRPPDAETYMTIRW